jgi:dihydrofolate reductase
MGKLILHMITSLDGFITDRHGSGPGPGGQYDEEVQRFYLDLFTSAGAVIYGRGIYNQYVGYWRHVASGDQPPANDLELRWTQRLMEMPKYVISKTQTDVYRNTTILRDTDTIPQLKKETEGDILLICGPTLCAELLSKQIIDEFMLYVCPAVYGKGTLLFQELPDNLLLNFEKIIPFKAGMDLHYYTPNYNGGPSPSSNARAMRLSKV